MGLAAAFDRDWSVCRAHPPQPPVVVADERYLAPNDVFDYVNGRYLVHAENVCMGERACVVHRPSDHGMRALPMLIRETTLTERMCPHGVGHPDPDSVEYFESVDRPGFGIHGCDGCCSYRWLVGGHVECPECGSPMSEYTRWVCDNYGGCELSAG